MRLLILPISSNKLRRRDCSCCCLAALSSVRSSCTTSFVLPKYTSDSELRILFLDQGKRVSWHVNECSVERLTPDPRSIGRCWGYVRHTLPDSSPVQATQVQSEISRSTHVPLAFLLTSRVIVPLSDTPFTPAASSAADAFPTHSMVVDTILYCA